MAEPWFATAFGAHYLTLYAHRDEAEAARCVALLAGAGLLASPLLDMGCGDGRHLAVLPEPGSVVGLDYSAPLLDAARARAPGRPLLRGDMRRLPVASGCLGTVLSLFTAFGYFDDDRQNEQPVAEAARVLRPGGHWCLDFLDGDRVRTELGDGRPAPRRRRSGALTVREVRRFDAATQTVSKQVELRPAPGCEAEAAAVGVGPGGLSYREQVRVFRLEEIEAMAARHELRRVAAWGGYGGEPLGAGDRWLLAFRRGVGAGGRP